MSVKSDKFEQDIVNHIQLGSCLPTVLPAWMSDIGVKEGARVTSVRREGASGGKVDVRVDFDKGAPLLISAKLANADYYGNWYSHKRVLAEFGDDFFDKITLHCTDWANDTWVKSENASLFVGVSICFGKRAGVTGIDFSSFFGEEGIRKIVQGNGLNKANCLLVSDIVPKKLGDLVKELAPIDSKTLLSLGKEFKVIYRPINPMTEGSNRGKCAYTQFKPYRKPPSKTNIKNLSSLMEYGKFHVVDKNSVNHNRILDSLESYNLFIPRK